MDPVLGPSVGFDNGAALASAVAVLVAVLVAVERLLVRAVSAADAMAGRDRCHFCGSALASRGSLGHETRCRRCERSQPARGLFG